MSYFITSKRKGTLSRHWEGSAKKYRKSLKINIGVSVGKCPVFNILDQVEEMCYAQILGRMLGIFPENITEMG